jgi:NAD(P)H-dependent flavin oxidoreductase YrpB (nitropropane dioxygenase family)
VNHLGYPPGTTVDLKREFLPAGQGVGAIDAIVPAGDIVREMMREATETLERLTSLRNS